MDSLKQLILEKKQALIQKAKAPSYSIAPAPVKSVSTPEPQAATDSPSITLSPQELIFRLRKLKQPAILFGENFSDQYKRLKAAEIKLIEEGKGLFSEKIDLDKLEEGLEGDRTMYWQSEYIDQAKECQKCEDEGLVWKKEKWQHPFMVEAGLISYQQKTLIIFMWWREILRLWKENLDNSESVMYKKTLSIFRQFILLLKAEGIFEDHVCLYFATVRFCQIKSYVKAHDMYLKLSATGNFEDEFPKNTKRLSDQSFRKYTQTFKRILSLAQKFIPDDPSRIVSM